MRKNIEIINIIANASLSKSPGAKVPKKKNKFGNS